MYKELYIEDIEELAAIMIADITTHAVSNACAIAKFDVASALIKELLRYDEVGVRSVECIFYEINGYEDEYIVLINDRYELDCEPIAKNDTYVRFDADKVYINEDCKQKVINNINDEKIVVIISDDF